MPKDKMLDPRPVAPLTSREIAKLIGGMIGTLGSWCDWKEIRAAIEFTAANLDAYEQVAKASAAQQEELRKQFGRDLESN